MTFELILTLIVIITGIISFIGRFLLKDHPSKIIVQCRSFFPVLLFVLIFRSFIFEPFRIPSGSLEPTLLIGDFVAVNKFKYGLRLPVTQTLILPLSKPERGDIVVFHWPPNPSVYYIKRVIGLPGDKVEYINKTLRINGETIKTQDNGIAIDIDGRGIARKVKKRSEALAKHPHDIYVRPDVPASDFSVTVPQGQYFVLGDNRDDSGDSRFWGFVPAKNIVGGASLIWLSWDSTAYKLRFNRMGKWII